MMKLSLSAPRYSKPSTLPQDSPDNYEFISKIDDHAYVQSRICAMTFIHFQTMMVEENFIYDKYDVDKFYCFFQDFV